MKKGSYLVTRYDTFRFFSCITTKELENEINNMIVDFGDEEEDNLSDIYSVYKIDDTTDIEVEIKKKLIVKIV